MPVIRVSDEDVFLARVCARRLCVYLHSETLHWTRSLSQATASSGGSELTNVNKRLRHILGILQFTEVRTDQRFSSARDTEAESLKGELSLDLYSNYFLLSLRFGRILRGFDS